MENMEILPDKDIYEKTKCAEVYRNERGHLTYLCLICTVELTNHKAFEDHIQLHFPDCLSSFHKIYEEPKEPDPNATLLSLGTIPKFDLMSSAINQLVIECEGNFKKELKPTKTIKCKDCDEHFYCHGLKEEHIQTHHLNNKFHRCVSCTASFLTADELHDHNLLHNMKTIQKCPYCNQIFKYQSMLYNHLKKKPDLGNFVDIRQIVNDTEPEPIFFCEKCHTNTRAKCYCKVHNLPKKISGNYKCEVCYKKYKSVSNFYSHIRRHMSAQFPYTVPELKCEKCNESCNKYTYKKHMKRHAAEEKSVIFFECDKCGKKFKMKNHLISHLLAAHKDILKSKNNNSIGDLSNKDIKKKKNKSSIGDLSSGHKGIKKTKNNTKYDQTQSIKMHTNAPKKELKFKCAVCSKAFVVINQLIVHMQTHNNAGTKFQFSVSNKT